MPATATTPATAAALLVTVRPFRPAAEGDTLALSAAPPEAVRSALSVLHTGVRAVLTGRGWWSCGSDRATAAPLPSGVTLLCVAGDPRWDRIDPAARLDHPTLFAAAPPAPGCRHPGWDWTMPGRP